MTLVCQGTRLHMALPVLMMSLLGVLFSTNTMNLAEGPSFTSDYTQATLEETGLWDTLFWAFCSLAHLVLVMLVTTPGDSFATALAGILDP